MPAGTWSELSLLAHCQGKTNDLIQSPTTQNSDAPNGIAVTHEV